MFGYITANLETLSEAERERYRACYCGLCRCLGQRGGLGARMTLNYDMTFLVLLLSSLYEPQEQEGSGRCPVHPAKRRDYFISPITAYGADMNVALCYHNCMDDWRDERRLLRYGEAKILEGRCQAIAREYPRQWQAILSALAALSQVEAEGGGLDPGANAFGELMGELFVYDAKDRFAPALRRMAGGLGRFIYLMDAYEDLPRDKKRGSYNPLLPLAGRPDFEGFIREMMNMMLGECAVEFEKLPLVQDAGILRNILYAGLWTKYAMIQTKKRGDANDPGSL